MTVGVVIIIAFLISFSIIYIVLYPDKFSLKKKHEHQELINKIHSRIAKANGASIEQFSLENLSDQSNKEADIYKDAQFVNKNCTNLEEFIINDDINEYDLKKLADLNGIKLQISTAWYPMTIELIKKLNDKGWDKKVSCIKEKYASLRFYTSSGSNDIIEEYEKMSEHVCETCGERGEIRHNTGWDYVACRKHYLENRGKIVIESNGFVHNGNFYKWPEVKSMYFEDKDYYNKYGFLRIVLHKHRKVNHQGWTDNQVYISRNCIGFGDFLNHIPDTFEGLDYDYIKNFKNVNFCEICGYKAVYFDKCECCENDSWKGYKNKWKCKEDEKEEHIKYYQILWAIDEGDKYEQQQNNYPKNLAHQIIFTEEELNEYKD